MARSARFEKPCSLINYTASTLGPPQPNPPHDLDRASMPLCLGCSSAVPRILPTNLNPQATGFPNSTKQTMIEMVDHCLYSWSRHRSLQWTAQSKNNRRKSPLTVISKSVLNFNGTSLPTILLHHRNICATAGRIEIGARLWNQSPLPILL